VTTMSKTLVGVSVGAILGFIDGMSATFTPAVQDMLLQIVVGSTLKGFGTGLAAGFVAQRTRDLKKTLTAGLVVGLVLSGIAAYATPDSNGQRYYLQIMLPGALLGVLAGFSSQRYGSAEPAR
jgi:peptidoglycan/LPS O-acetylase OafA/YrhL